MRHTVENWANTMVEGIPCSCCETREQLREVVTFTVVRDELRSDDQSLRFYS